MKEQILIVEDDLAMSTGIRDVLDMAGYKVQLAENGLEALQVLTRFRPDLIISDIMMPEMDGFELLEQVRRRPNWAVIPFIFLTAKGQRTDIRAGKQLGADDYLVKSVDLDDLLVVVRAKLDRAIVLKQQSLKEMENLKNTILNMLSHEFRTPLTYITGYVDLMQEGNWSADDLQKFLSRIKGGSTRLNRLVEDFLLLVRFETDDAHQAYLMDKRPFNAWHLLINRVFEGLQDAAAVRHVALVAEIAPNLPLVDAHENYLENALHRLVDNAIKFSKPGGAQVIARVTAGRPAGVRAHHRSRHRDTHPGTAQDVRSVPPDQSGADGTAGRRRQPRHRQRHRRTASRRSRLHQRRRRGQRIHDVFARHAVTCARLSDGCPACVKL